ncbi:hypothetical protein [Dinghuibacter silviterrae]|uniref:Uncharacterized protein n=1 Tax=Dinghuibacter silviterrae TaxID=1539049 RepID=A0A4R8DGA8_9BACT|nr:hypothetical protein [Dinghuibacter silviterrae]TDW96663.1 hypothetical protein EDB95_4498 [Dinghuibacter silviterrae]
MKKKNPVAASKLTLSDFAKRDNAITSSVQLSKINGGGTDNSPRPPLVIMTR